MNKEVKKGLVPKLRFSKFLNAGEWNEKPLGKIAEIITGNTPQTSDSDNYVGNKMFVSPADISDSRYIVKTKTTLSELGYSKTRHIPANSVLFVCIGSTIGKIAQNKFDCATNQQINSVVPFKNYSSDFLYFALDNDSSRIAELAGRQAVPIINKSSFSAVSINIPPEEKEQTKIAACLSSLDDLITAQTQKIEALKTHKKGLMQQLFPQEGETVPKLRFPEFEGDWEEKNGNLVFEQISNKQHNSDLPILAITQEFGAIPRELIDYKVFVTDKSVETYKVVEKGDFIISLRSFQGGIEYSEYKGICSPAYIILRKKIDVSKSYFKHFFKSERFIQQLNKNLEGLRDGKMVSYKQFSELFLPVPSKPEQQKIADCLSSLDDLINAQVKKCDALKLHKKGLMQGLFPSSNEAA